MCCLAPLRGLCLGLAALPCHPRQWMPLLLPLQLQALVLGSPLPQRQQLV